MKLGLGTAQFGAAYGVTNQAGQVPKEEVERIFVEAAKRDVLLIDTAPVYGTSEEVIGRTLPRNTSFMIVTKTLPLTETDGIDAVVRGFEQSLALLEVPYVYGLLVHRVADLLGPAGEQLFARLESLRKTGMVRKLGASVYEPGEVFALLGRFAVDLIQLPLNVFDQRMVNSGALSALRNKGVEIHARSVFLQGILLADPESTTGIQPALIDRVARFRELARAHGVSPMAAALSFIQSKEVEAAIIGVTSLAEFKEVIAAVEVRGEVELPWSELAVDDAALIDPRGWSL